MRRIITMVPAPFYKSYTHVLHNCMIVMVTIKMELSFFKLHTAHTGLPTYVCSSTLPGISFQKVLCLSHRCLGEDKVVSFRGRFHNNESFKSLALQEFQGFPVKAFNPVVTGRPRNILPGRQGNCLENVFPNDCFLLKG